MERHDPEPDEEEAAPLLRGKTDRMSAAEPTQALLSVILLPTLLAQQQYADILSQLLGSLFKHDDVRHAHR